MPITKRNTARPPEERGSRTCIWYDFKPHYGERLKRCKLGVYHFHPNHLWPCFEENAETVPCSGREFNPNVKAIPTMRKMCCHASETGCKLGINILANYGQNSGYNGVMWFIEQSPCMKKDSDFPCSHQNFESVKPGKRRIIVEE